MLNPRHAAAWAAVPDKASLNMTVEQFLLPACLDFHRFDPGSPHRGVYLRYLFPSTSAAFDPAQAARLGFTHLLAEAKQDAQVTSSPGGTPPARGPGVLPALRTRRRIAQRRHAMTRTTSRAAAARRPAHTPTPPTSALRRGSALQRTTADRAPAPSTLLPDISRVSVHPENAPASAWPTPIQRYGIEPASAGRVLRRCGGKTCPPGTCDHDGELRRHSTAPGSATAPPLVHQVLGTTGEQLHPAARSYLEPRFGHDFSTVRVHTDMIAATSAEAVGARAYTVGNHIAFAAGVYAPHTEYGRRLIAHELAHTLQQGAGRQSLIPAPSVFAAPSPPGITQPALVVGPIGDPLEGEADRVADQVMRMPDSDPSVTDAPPQLDHNGAAGEAEGRSIVFDRGRYAPHQDAGRRLLAHELVHTIQQGRSGPPSRGERLSVESSGSAREGEARKIAEMPSRLAVVDHAAAADGGLRVQRLEVPPQPSPEAEQVAEKAFQIIARGAVKVGTEVVPEADALVATGGTAAAGGGGIGLVAAAGVVVVGAIVILGLSYLAVKLYSEHKELDEYGGISPPGGLPPEPKPLTGPVVVGDVPLGDGTFQPQAGPQGPPQAGPQAQPQGQAQASSQKRHPKQKDDCPNELYDTLRGEIDKCKDLSFSCLDDVERAAFGITTRKAFEKPGAPRWPREEILRRLEQAERCAKARDDFQTKCFLVSPGDPEWKGHDKQRRDWETAAKRCREKARARGYLP